MILFKFAIGSLLVYLSSFIYSNAQNVINNALYLNAPNAFNSTKEDCKWKHGNERDICPDPDINVIMYTSSSDGKNRGKLRVDVEENDFLRMSAWNDTKENVILVHGYAGGDDVLPMVVLRDAYLQHGDFNVFVVDWSVISQPPCYVAAVHNLKTVAHCVAKTFTYLRNLGLSPDRTTCIGHSLGAHICGLMSNHLNFRMERIVALDPARPLIRQGNQNRLDSGDAKSVQVIHTNAGYYGEGGRVGHIDFCVNGGRRQPYCHNTTNVNLCSHIWAVCYMARSIFDSRVNAEPCIRKCPSGVVLQTSASQTKAEKRRTAKKSRYGFAINYGIPMGQSTPKTATGSYCVRDSDELRPPFCPPKRGDVGDSRCCLDAPEWKDLF